MFENIGHFFKRIVKTEQQKELGSKDAAKERLHLVLMQDRANVSADFLELMKQEIIDVIKKYIVVDEAAIDVRLTNQSNEDGTNGAPALYANIPIVNIKNDMMAEKIKDFEGVDFNKEMGILVPDQTEENKEEKAETPEVIELSESYEETKVNENLNQEETENSESETEVKEEIEENNDNNEEINNDNESEESEEAVELFEEVDEDDDDDVTFDDLLKAAEEEDKNAEMVEENNINKGGKKNRKKSKDKRNRRN